MVMEREPKTQGKEVPYLPLLSPGLALLDRRPRRADRENGRKEGRTERRKKKKKTKKKKKQKRVFYLCPN
jgi:hypothetical protein